MFRCDFCDRLLCERHIDPRLAFIPNFNPKGYPAEVEALYEQERKRQDGHPDFGYSQMKFLELDIEEKTQNELIKQAMDRMMHPDMYVDLTVDSDSDRKKRVEILKNEERELPKQQSEQDIASDEYTKSIGKTETITIENFYGDRFVVPREVYSNAEYREYLNYAKTMKSVRVIVDEYYKKHKKQWWQ